ncbi:HAD hydrolase-like protein [Dorea acetigenes]|uniref:HAD hydrolase-like protein n=1 Tax=Dorea acetigenes TaxID=2981787 RepID=A0ABT2RS02_9FIRM|nr:HAD hydrolase-like protein [Dorea acetigenes]MCU6688180.1 HAD hydrolase-like protein [Dorea acetigenes]SCJ68262.1 5'-nucleotidase [uncultured Clostridium sp.]
MKNKYELVIFDLDGTLLDTSPGIFNSVRFAEQQMGFTPILDARLKEFVGPPPKSMYMKIYGVDENTAMEAAKCHRQYGREKAIYEATVYPGIIALLENFKEQGIKLAVSTLKSQKIAEKVLENFGISHFFDSIVGMDENESFTKCDTIKLVINKTSTVGRVLMVGDSRYDYEGAVSAGVDFVGVLYGFGFESKKKYPFSTVEQVEELMDLHNIIEIKVKKASCIL